LPRCCSSPSPRQSGTSRCLPLRIIHDSVPTVYHSFLLGCQLLTRDGMEALDALPAIRQRRFTESAFTKAALGELPRTTDPLASQPIRPAVTTARPARRAVCGHVAAGSKLAAISVLRRALDAAKLDDRDKIDGIERLNRFVGAIEQQCRPEADFDGVVAHERAISAELGGKTVQDDAKIRRTKTAQLRLF
jgi:hypothetical protein